jgi:phage shock protein A
VKRRHNLFARLERLIRRNLAVWLSDDFDETIEEIDQLIWEATGELERARDAVAAALVQEKSVEREMLAAVALAEEWDTRAQRALVDGQDTEARFAVERKLAYAHTIENLRAELAKQSETIAHLRSRTYEFQVQIEAAQRQREIVHARHERQETEEQIRRAFGRSEAIRDLRSVLEQAVARSEERDAILEAARELERGSIDARLERAQRELDVDAELDALRARLGQGPGGE